MSSSRLKIGSQILLAVALFCAGLLYTTIPPSPDQWFLDYTGWMMSSGAVPYQQFADGNWPACHWLHALSTSIFGNTRYSWRLFDYLLMLSCTLAAANLMRKLWGRSAANWMLILYPCLYVVQGIWFSGQRDIVAGNLCFVALWFYWRGLCSRKSGWQLGTGLVIAFASLIKPTFAAMGLFLALHAAVGVALKKFEPRTAAIQVGVAGLASVTSLGLGFLVLAYQGTPLSLFWEFGVESVLLRFDVDHLSTTELLSKGALYAFHCWHWILGLGALSFLWHVVHGGRKELASNLLFPALWATGLLSYIVQVKGFGYTLGAVFVATVPILCSGLGPLSERIGSVRGWHRVLAIGIVILVVGGTMKKWVGMFGSSVEYLTGQVTAEEHYGNYLAGDGMTTWEAISLARELGELVPEDGTIFVWGRANVINFLSQRPQPTRFHHNVILVRTGISEALARQWNQWFREELEETKPEVCVINLEVPAFSGRSTPESVVFLRHFLEQNYRPDRQVGKSRVYLRKPN